MLMVSGRIMSVFKRISYEGYTPISKFSTHLLLFSTDPQFRSNSQKLYRLYIKRNKNNFLNQPLRVRTTTVLY